VRPDLSIVIPAYREGRYVVGTLAALHTELVRRGWLARTEVIVVTATAPDDTVALVRATLPRFPRHLHLEPGPKVGKGRDVRAGMLAASGELVMFMDADLATPLRHLGAMVARLEDDADVVIGCRDLASIHGHWRRRLASQVANRLVQALLLPGLDDTQCGFKGFRGSIVRELFEPLGTMGWGFDFEILARARRGGYHVAELPVPDWADPKGDLGLAGEPQWRATLNTLRELVAVAAELRRQAPRGGRAARLHPVVAGAGAFGRAVAMFDRRRS
jgi:glycosyltransferase involved in cell wall biosynthesis